jgi:hypothetical protein
VNFRGRGKGVISHFFEKACDPLSEAVDIDDEDVPGKNESLTDVHLTKVLTVGRHLPADAPASKRCRQAEKE